MRTHYSWIANDRPLTGLKSHAGFHLHERPNGNAVLNVERIWVMSDSDQVLQFVLDNEIFFLDKTDGWYSVSGFFIPNNLPVKLVQGQLIWLQAQRINYYFQLGVRKLQIVISDLLTRLERQNGTHVHHVPLLSLDAVEEPDDAPGSVELQVHVVDAEVLEQTLRSCRLEKGTDVHIGEEGVAARDWNVHRRFQVFVESGVKGSVETATFPSIFLLCL